MAAWESVQNFFEFSKERSGTPADSAMPAYCCLIQVEEFRFSRAVFSFLWQWGRWFSLQPLGLLSAELFKYSSKGKSCLEGLTTGDLQDVFKAERKDHINWQLLNFNALSNMQKKKNQEKKSKAVTQDVFHIVLLVGGTYTSNKIFLGCYYKCLFLSSFSAMLLPCKRSHTSERPFVLFMSSPFSIQ